MFRCGDALQSYALLGVRVYYNHLMRILATSDLHYNIPRSRASAQDVARRACELGGDVLVLVGDTAGADLTPFREALRLFADFPGRKLVVPGNHCLWCYGGGDSIDRYNRVLPEMAADEGFSVLDHQPLELDGIGLAGSVGWYDYSFADSELAIPLPFYQAKVSPGAAAYMGMEDLTTAHAHLLQERHLSLGVRWMDGMYVRLGMSDEQFTQQLADRLEAQLKILSQKCHRIIVLMHHLPFIELVPQDRPMRFAFAAAYMGARRLGEVLCKFTSISDVLCGHSHWRSEVQIDHIRVVAIGSTYVEKHLEVIEA